MLYVVFVGVISGGTYWPFPLDQKANTSIEIFGWQEMAEKALSKALSRLNILREDREIVLKPEQETAV